MLSWFFKKRGRAAPLASPVTLAAAPPSAAAREQARTETRARQVDGDRAEWAPRLSAAQGDDAALLALALAAPLPDIRLAAVEAMVGEDLLRQAEREFRSRDRRAHSSAKRRLEAAVAQREASTRAATLIITAQNLVGLTQVPVNHLVALDRDWQALAAAGLTPALRLQFSDLREQIDRTMQDHDRQRHELRRWTAEADGVVTRLLADCAAAAAGGVPVAVLTSGCEAAQALRETCPPGPDGARLDPFLALAMQIAAALVVRLDWLAAQGVAIVAPAVADPVPAPVAADVSADVSVDGSAGADPAPAAPAPPPVAIQAADQWKALLPLPDAALARLLDQQFEQWRRQQVTATLAPAAPVIEAPKAPRVPRPSAQATRARSPNADECLQLDGLLGQAEASLAEGQLGGLQQHLSAFDAALDAMGAVLPAAADLLVRHQVLLAERLRLKGWQQWGGGQAREALAAEAEALAGLTLAAADPATPDAPALPLKAHGEAIQTLRTRWRELDRLGAAAPQALWQRFDAALQTAYQPLAAKQMVLKAARQDNLAARQALLAALETFRDLGNPVEPAVAARGGDQFGFSADTAADTTAELSTEVSAEMSASPWKEPLRALDRFHTAWRQLGPLEHTVPAAAREALQQRLRRSLDRIEQPLQQARQAAEAVREQMIAHAQSLLSGPDQPVPPPDAVQQARGLQFDWQQHARSLPLARGVENALWARFKTAIDAVYGQREAVFRARDAELDEHLAECEAWLQRLVALADDSLSSAERERGLAEIDRAWRQPGELPRGAAERLAARYREARATVALSLTAAAQRQWQAQCDALGEQLGLCEQRELADAGGAELGDSAELAARWATQPALPKAWGLALAQRWAGAAATGPLPTTEVDALLLQLEAALDLPATAEQQAARQQLKLLAMKDKFEGRASARPAAPAPADALTALLRQGGVTALQRSRLLALVAALRHGQAGALVAPIGTIGSIARG